MQTQWNSMVVMVHGKIEIKPQPAVGAGHGAGRDFNFWDLLFGPDDPFSDGHMLLQSQMKAKTESGGTFRTTVEVTNPQLRSMMCLKQDQAMHLDCLISLTTDGQGALGVVHKGMWRNLTVAINSMVLPLVRGKDEDKQRMAIMEAAMSSSLVHRNIVKTHHYTVKPIRDAPSAASNSNCNLQPPITAFQVQLVLEFCDMGSLWSALQSGMFHHGSMLNYKAQLEVAIDIAMGMKYLHDSGILHTDLKPGNILLQSSDDANGLTAKIIDFGLSISKLDSGESHVSNMYHGTKAFMAPEAHSSGKQSNAANSYSFGITLYELFTSTPAFKNIDPTILVYKVIHSNLRPIFPLGTPSGYQDLAEACWDHDPSKRPSFESIISTLKHLREAEVGETTSLMANYSLLVGLYDTVGFDNRSQSESLSANGPDGPDESPPINETHTEDFWRKHFGY